MYLTFCSILSQYALSTYNTFLQILSNINSRTTLLYFCQLMNYALLKYLPRLFLSRSLETSDVETSKRVPAVCLTGMEVCFLVYPTSEVFQT